MSSCFLLAVSEGIWELSLELILTFDKVFQSTFHILVKFCLVGRLDLGVSHFPIDTVFVVPSLWIVVADLFGLEEMVEVVVSIHGMTEAVILVFMLGGVLMDIASDCSVRLTSEGSSGRSEPS